MSTTEQLFAAVYAEPASDAPRLLEFRYTSKGKSFTAEEMQPMKHAVAKQQRLQK